jgi:hypothetical protein
VWPGCCHGGSAAHAQSALLGLRALSLPGYGGTQQGLGEADGLLAHLLAAC